MDFKRGRQVVLHDPRLATPGAKIVGAPSEEMWWLGLRAIAPKAWANFEADPKKDTVAKLFAAVAMRVSIARLTGVKEVDALHIMAHGLQGAIELGSDWLHRPTMPALGKIAGMFRYVVIHSCLVGKVPQNAPAFMSSTTFGGSQFARKAAELTKSTVVVARQEQMYSVTKVKDPTKGEIYFGEWEGPVDVYQEGLPVRTYNGIIDDAFDLESLIFGAKKA